MIASGNNLPQTNLHSRTGCYRELIKILFRRKIQVLAAKYSDLNACPLNFTLEKGNESIE